MGKLEIQEKEKNGKVYKNVRLSDIEPKDSVVVEKMFDTGFKVETKFGTAYAVKLKYNDEEVSTFMSEKLYDDWLKVPKGKVEIERTLIQDKDKKWIMPYKIKSLEEGGEEEVEEVKRNTEVLTDKQLKMLKYYNENKKTPDDLVQVTNDNGEVEQKRFRDVIPVDILNTAHKYL